jgi:hypothetical protein
MQILGLISIFVTAYFTMRLAIAIHHYTTVDMLNVGLWAAGVVGVIACYGL